jgi:hypothetical protein
VKLKAFNDKYYLSVRKRAEFLARYSAGSIGMNLMGSEV